LDDVVQAASAAEPARRKLRRLVNKAMGTLPRIARRVH
jgi:hypothetical protein